MIELSNIIPFSSFKKNFSTHLYHLQKMRQPYVLTLHGEAAMVVQDIETYKEIANLAEHARKNREFHEMYEQLSADKG